MEYYSLGQAAQVAGVHYSVLRYATLIGRFSPVVVADKKAFTKQQVEEIRAHYAARNARRKERSC
jgi:hypothetical protein